MDAALARLAARQHGVARLDHLKAAGLTDSAITKRVARGLLHRRHRAVYAIGRAALSREGEMLAAVFAGAPGTVVSHLALAELLALTRRPAPIISVLSPRRRTLEGVEVHTYRRLDRRDVTTHEGIPVTTIHRLFVDLADIVPTPHELAAYLREAAAKGRFVELAIRDAMERASGRHNLDLLERAIALHKHGSAGTRSRNEVLFLRLPLPEPLVNTRLFGFELDFLWPELKLNVEVDGPQHYTAPGRRADEARDRVLRAHGYVVLRFPDEDVRERPGEVLRTVEAWVSSRGTQRAA